MAVKYVDNFEFPSESGFTGSTGTVQTVRPHSRRVPLHDRMIEEGARRGFKSGGHVKQDTMDHANTQRRAKDAPTQQLKEMGNQPPVQPGFSKGGKVKELEESLSELYKRRATTGGHTRRARMNERIDQLQNELDELKTKKVPPTEGKARGGTVRSAGRGHNSKPMFGRGSK